MLTAQVVLQMGAEYPVSAKHIYLMTETAFKLSLAGPGLITSRDLVSLGAVTGYDRV
jgi:hypothetical protein